jgi:hypothetical protein
VIDPEPEASIGNDPPECRAWYCWKYLSNTSTVLSVQSGHTALKALLNLKQGGDIHSLSTYKAAFHAQRRILLAAPRAIIPAPEMMAHMLKLGLNARCRLHAEKINFAEGGIDDWFVQVELFENEWLTANGHALPGPVAPAIVQGIVSAASGGGRDVQSAEPAVTCAFCEKPGHCRDKCGRLSKLLRTEKMKIDEEKSARKKDRKKSSGDSNGGAGAGGGASKGRGDKKNSKGTGKSAKDQSQRKSEAPCWEFQKEGSCSKGTNCRFSHIPGGKVGAAASGVDR